MQLTPNVGTLDRIIRFAVAVGLLFLAIFAGLSTLLVWISVAVAAILAATAFTGFCPIYAVLRLSTRPAHR